MVGVELRITAIRAGPVQIQAVIAIDLLRGRAAMDLHGGLLIAIVARDIECAQRGPRHLRHGGPGVATARNFLQ